MGSNCCKSEQGQEITEQDNYGNAYTCNQNNHEDIFKTRPPCMYGYQCSCPCHRGGQCIFQLKAK